MTVLAPVTVIGDILIIDDQPEALQWPVDTLAEAGYKVRLASSDAHALSVAQPTPPDLILLDIAPPRKSGYEVYRQLQANKATCDIPVLFLCDAGSALHEIHTSASGGNDYITKPFAPEELLARVDTQLTIRHLRRKVETQTIQLEREASLRGAAEAALLKIRDKLETEVKTRMAELAQVNARLKQEIIERKRAEEILRQRETFNQATLNSLIAHIAVLDKNGVILSVNEAWKKFAVANDATEVVREGIGLNYLEICRTASGPASDRAQECLTGLQKVLDGSLTQFSMEYPCHSPTEERWFLLNAVPLHHQAGGLVVSHIEVTKLTQIQAALRQSEARYRAIVEDQTELICRFLPDGTPTFVNEAYCRYFAKTQAEIIDHSFMPLIHEDDREMAEEYLAALRSQTPVGLIEHRVTLPDGDVRWLQWQNRAIFNDQGEIVEFQGVGRDITQRMQAEAELQQHREHLEELVEEKTTELYQRVKELSTLNQITREIVNESDFHVILDMFTATVSRLLGASGVSVYLLNDYGTRLTDSAQFVNVPALMVADSELARLINRELPAIHDPDIHLVLKEGEPLLLSLASSETPSDDRGKVRHLMRNFNVNYLLLIPLAVRGNVIGILTIMTDEAGSEFTTNEMILAETLAGQVAGVIESARLLEQEQQHSKVVEQHSHELATLLQLAHNITSTLDLDPLLNLILEQLEAVVAYSSCAIIGLDENKLSILAYRGVKALSDVESLLFSAQPVITNKSLFAQPIIIDDLWQDKRFLQVKAAMLDPQVTDLLSRVRSGIAIPLITHDRIIGFLGLGSHESNFYTNEQAEYIQAFADQAAIAIENARLYHQAQANAVNAERNRLARDLHDAVTQSLYAASLIAEALPQAWEQSPEKGRRGLAELKQLTHGALTEMRSLLSELRLADFDQKTLAEVMKILCTGAEIRIRIPVTFTVNRNCSQPADVKMALYRIAQEALNNIFKHAAASQAAVVLDCQPEQITLRIEDDGVGFDPGTTLPEHLGLSIMRERAAAIGAEIRIESQLQQGTQVTVVWQSGGAHG